MNWRVEKNLLKILEELFPVILILEVLILLYTSLITDVKAYMDSSAVLRKVTEGDKRGTVYSETHNALAKSVENENQNFINSKDF